MDVVVEVGDWEHECCGKAIERNQLVDFQCIRYTGGRTATCASSRLTTAALMFKQVPASRDG